jgi:hypothetical protein
MTVKQLIERLNQVENKNRIVVMSRDPEGNGYAPLSVVDEGSAYKDGEVGIETLTEDDRKQGYSEEDVLKGRPALVLWPQ